MCCSNVISRASVCTGRVSFVFSFFSPASGPRAPRQLLQISIWNSSPSGLLSQFKSCLMNVRFTLFCSSHVRASHHVFGTATWWRSMSRAISPGPGWQNMSPKPRLEVYGCGKTCLLESPNTAPIRLLPWLLGWVRSLSVQSTHQIELEVHGFPDIWSRRSLISTPNNSVSRKRASI